MNKAPMVARGMYQVGKDGLQCYETNGITGTCMSRSTLPSWFGTLDQHLSRNKDHEDYCSIEKNHTWQLLLRIVIIGGMQATF